MIHVLILSPSSINEIIACFLTRLAEESAQRSSSAADYQDLNTDDGSDDEVVNTASLTEMYKYQEDRSDFIAEFTSHNAANRNSHERLNSEYPEMPGLESIVTCQRDGVSNEPP